MRKAIYHTGSALGTIGTLLLLGSLVVWLIGLETLTRLYDANKPFVLVAVVGVVFLTIGIVLTSFAAGRDLVAPTSAPGTAPGAEKNLQSRCVQCAASNAPLAKFCDQCGAGLTGP